MGNNVNQGVMNLGRKSIKSLKLNKKKISETNDVYVSKRLHLEPQKLNQEEAAIYVLDQSVNQVPSEGDAVKEEKQKEMNLSEMHEKTLQTKQKVKSLFNLDQLKQSNSEQKQSVGNDIAKTFKFMGKGALSGLGAGVNVLGKLAKNLDILDLAQQGKKALNEEKIELDKIDSLNDRNNHVESLQGKDFKNILEQGMLYSSLNNLSLDTNQESTNSICDQKLNLQTIRIKLIKLDEKMIYVVTGDNEKTKNLQLHVLTFNENTNRLEKTYERILFEHNQEKEEIQVTHTNVWKQNGQFIYFFEKKGLEPVKQGSTSDILSSNQQDTPLFTYKLKRYDLIKNKEELMKSYSSESYVTVVFSQDGINNRVLPSQGIDQKKFFETTFVAMCNEYTSYSVRRLSDFRKQLAHIPFKLAGDDQTISCYLTFILQSEPQHEQLQIKNDALVFSHKNGSEGDSSKQKIWNVISKQNVIELQDYVQQTKSNIFGDILKASISGQLIKNLLNKQLESFYQTFLLEDFEFYSIERDLQKNEYLQEIRMLDAKTKLFYEQFGKQIQLFLNKDSDVLILKNILFSYESQTCVLSYLTTESEILLVKGTYNSAFTIQPFVEKNLHPYTIAAHKIEHGQQVFKEYNNVFKQAVPGQNANFVYIDEEGEIHKMSPIESEILFESLKEQQRQRRPIKIKKNLFGSITSDKDIQGDDEDENVLLDNIHLDENAHQKRISMQSDSYIRPRISPPDENEISLFLEIFDFKNKKTLFKTPIIDYQQKDSSKYLRQKLVESSQQTLKKNSKHEYSQNWQWICIHESLLQIKILEFCVSWSKKDSKKSLAELVGQKIIMFKNKINEKENKFYPLYDKNDEIIGTQLLTESLHFQLRNFDDIDFQSKTNVACTGYKKYYRNSELFAIHMESYLSPQFKKYLSKFANQEILDILQDQNKIASNQVAYSLDFGAKNQFSQLVFSDFDFFQPIEVLQGNTLCDYYLSNLNLLEQRIKEKKDYKHQGIMTEFINKISGHTYCDNADLNSIHRKPQEISYDFHKSNCLQRCLQFKEKHTQALQIFLNEALQRESTSKDELEILIGIIPQILKSQESFQGFSQFFHDQLDEVVSKKKVTKLRFATRIHQKELPDYSNHKQELRNFNTSQIPLLDADIEAIMTQDICKHHNSKKQVKFNIPVIHYYLDLRIMRLYQKLNMLQLGKDITDLQINDFFVADLVKEINKKYSRDVESMTSLRSIIDVHFVASKNYFRMNALVYAFFFLTPFMYQLFQIKLEYKDLDKLDSNYQYELTERYDEMVFNVRVVMVWCTTILAIPFLIELIKIKEAGENSGILKYYTKNFENVIDTVFYTVYVIYFIVRTWILPSDTMNENPYTQDLSFMQHIAEVNLLTMIIISFSVFRLFRFLSVYPKISQFMALMSQVFIDMLSFLLFYLTFVIMFALIQRILRQEANSPSSYPLIHDKIQQLFLDEFQDSIGNAQTPSYSVWVKFDKDYQQQDNINRPFVGPIFMVYVIWVCWMINQIFMLVLLLNFIIAIIQQSYDSVISQSIISEYKQKCQLNREYRVVMREINKTHPQDFIILSMQNNQGVTNDHFQGFVQTIKTAIKNQSNLNRNILIQTMQNENEEVMEHIETINSQISHLKNNQFKLEESINNMKQEVISEVQNLFYKHFKNSSEDPEAEAKAAFMVKLQYQFEGYDVAKKGFLSREEMKQLILNEYNANATEEYLEEQMNIFDENHDGQFDFDEIVEAINLISKEVSQEEAGAEIDDVKN